MHITKKELIQLIKEAVESEADRAREIMRAGLNDPSARLDRNLYSDMYAADREERKSRSASSPAPAPASSTKSSSSSNQLADLNNPMIANLFSPDELEQLRQKIRSGGERASTAADTVSSKISSAVEQLQNLASRFGLTEQKIIRQIVREELKKLHEQKKR